MATFTRDISGDARQGNRAGRGRSRGGRSSATRHGAPPSVRRGGRWSRPAARTGVDAGPGGRRVHLPLQRPDRRPDRPRGSRGAARPREVYTACDCRAQCGGCTRTIVSIIRAKAGAADGTEARALGRAEPAGCTLPANIHRRGGPPCGSPRTRRASAPASRAWTCRGRSPTATSAPSCARSASGACCASPASRWRRRSSPPSAPASASWSTTSPTASTRPATRR